MKKRTTKSMRRLPRPGSGAVRILRKEGKHKIRVLFVCGEGGFASEILKIGFLEAAKKHDISELFEVEKTGIRKAGLRRPSKEISQWGRSYDYIVSLAPLHEIESLQRTRKTAAARIASVIKVDPHKERLVDRGAAAIEEIIRERKIKLPEHKNH